MQRYYCYDWQMEVPKLHGWKNCETMMRIHSSLLPNM